MPLTLEIRRERWARFVRQALTTVQLQQGWTVKEVLERTKVGKTTLYRWLKGDWVTDPEPTKIEMFCDGLDIPTERAFAQLWPGKIGKAQATEPLPMPEDISRLLRRLNDPSVSEQEKAMMLAMVRSALHLHLDAPTPTRPRRA